MNTKLITWTLNNCWIIENNEVDSVIKMYLADLTEKYKNRKCTYDYGDGTWCAAIVHSINMNFSTGRMYYLLEQNPDRSKFARNMYQVKLCKV